MPPLQQRDHQRPSARAVGGSPLAGLRVLFINWRERNDPQAGGAELFCSALASQFGADGAEVTLFTSRPRGARPQAVPDGLNAVRSGGRWSVYPRAAWFMARNGGRFDAIIDSSNGIPFFSPLFARRRTAVVGVIYHVHQEQFSLHFRWPLSAIGRALERHGTRLVYGQRPMAVISPSTRAEVRCRLGYQGPLFVVPVAADTGQPESRRRLPSPRVVCLGRLVPHKRVELLLEAVPQLLPRWPDLAVDVIGDGPSLPVLRARAEHLGVGKVVRFRGFLPASARDRLLSQAWALAQPALNEGFGLSVLEASAHGVPAIACSVPGLVDAIRVGETGWLASEGVSFASTLEQAIASLADEREAAAYAERCRRWANQFSWAQSASRLVAIVASELDRVARSRSGERERRETSDLCCTAVFDDISTEASSRLRRSVRRTDLWREGEDQVAVTFYGADEPGVRRILERNGLEAEDATVRVATTISLLHGSAALEL